MILHQSNSSLIITIVMLMIIIFAREAKSGSVNCQRCGNYSLQYPFGVSAGSGHSIQLNCSKTGQVKVGDFIVENITGTSMVIKLPSKCNRSIQTIMPLFGENYSPSSQTSFLLQDCANPTNSCTMNSHFVQRQFNLRNCSDNGDLVCFSEENTGKFMNFDDMERTRCKFLFSSFSFDSSGKDSLKLLELERLELSWWLEGNCSDTTCSKNATCSPVKLANGNLGHRCQCNEGFHGDGFAGGEGCQRAASHCNASRFVFGQCRGAKVSVLVGGIIAGASLMAGLVLICYCFQRRSASLKNQMSAKRLLCEAAGNSSVPFFPYKEIEKATSGFSDKQRLGTGAYGTVYAGKLHNDEWVAIKRLRHRDTDSIDQVMNEIKLLSSVSHPNLVRLLGCCIEEGEPILVYEFMPNGTLSQHLQRERSNELPWTIRLTIATQTAKAIAYLHSAMNPPIYHRDIKSSNILLDYNYNSKVADFGLSRLGMTESSHISTAPQGTPGYLDPQYHQYFHLSDKSDVYSFGVVLVEIITALKVVDFSRPHSEVNLAALAIDRIGRGCVDEIIDPYVEPHRDAWTLSSVHNVAELAFRCLAFHRDMRPTMTEVAEELEKIRLSAWVPNMYIASPAASYCSSSDNGSEKSFRCVTVKKSSMESHRLIVSQRGVDQIMSLQEINDSSPVSVQDPWLSQQSSPSTNSLLGNVVR